MTNSTGLSGQTAAGDCGDNVVLTRTGRSDEWLLNHHAKHRAGKVNFDFARVDENLAGAWLDPDAGDRILALAGRIGAALLVDLLGVLRSFRRGRLELRQLIERLHGIRHNYAALLFLRFMTPTSTTSGCWASCGCSAPA